MQSALRLRTFPSLLITLTVSACASPGIGVHAPGDPAKPVRAIAETFVATVDEVDADDPALWADDRDPSRALLFGTDKSNGLYVHDLDGSVRQFLADGPLNNVDLRAGFVVGGKPMVLVVASDRRTFGIRTYLLDPDTLEVAPYGLIPLDIGEPYGLCLGRRGDRVFAVVNNKDGEILQIEIEPGSDGPIGTLRRRLRVATQPEGCVVDDRAQQLYIGEEDVAVWRFSFDPSARAEGTQVASVDGHRIAADIEGLAIMHDAGETYLIISSQGDSTFPVYRVRSDSYTYLGRFAVVDGEQIDGVSGTDGLSAWSGPIGPYTEGLIAMHDDEDAPGTSQQNYKLIDWRDVKQALGQP